MVRSFGDFITVPEERGTVMVIEKEFGPEGVRDWVTIARGIADIVKCTFGTAALYDEQTLRKKMEIYKEAGCHPMIGGTLTEVVLLEMGGYQRTELERYLKYSKSLGFTHIEISDGTIYIPDEDRADIIKTCLNNGLTVISEVGKKDPEKDARIPMDKRIELMKRDLQLGSTMVIIEARESGKGIGVMGKDGEVNFDELDQIIKSVGLQYVMIEAPEKKQQQSIYMRYGPGANIGNVQPRDILSVGALQCGLRGDTISSIRKKQWTNYHSIKEAPEEYNS